MIPPETLVQSSKRWFIGALFVAASVRLYLLWQYYCISSDGVVYIRTAQDFYAGNLFAGLGSVYPPGYPLMIAAVYPLIGHWELSGQLLSWVFGVLLLFPLYWIFADVFNQRIALLACFLAALNRSLALYSVHVRSESAYILFSTCALYLFLMAVEEKRRWRFFWGGLIAGYAYLIRPEAIGFLVIVPVIALLRWGLPRRGALLELISSFGLLFVGFLLCSVPYIVYLSLDTGRAGAISRKAGVTLVISLKESGLLEGEDFQTEDGGESLTFTDYVSRHPLRYLRKVLSDLFPAVGVFFEALRYSYAPFLLIGLFVALHKGFWAKPELLLFGFVIFYVFGFALIYVKLRYALQAVPISLGWVAIGIVYTWERLRAILTARKAAWVGIAVGLLLIGATLPKTLRPVSPEKAYVRETGWYLKERNPTGALKVAVFDDRITFYADALTLQLTGVSESELNGKLREQKADYLAAESKALRRVYPEVAQTPERYGLMLEKVFVGTHKDQVWLFKIV
jgi:4-amino-4-deoxy-L-arabinose transferase-like glycosyltransferase